MAYYHVTAGHPSGSERIYFIRHNEKKKSSRNPDDWKVCMLIEVLNGLGGRVRRLAQAGLLVYSNWVASKSLEKVSDNAFVNIGHLQVNQLATGSGATPLHEASSRFE
ncbi:7248_t:CDS:2 [Funneliformis geosporum]|uniref:7248_t:CDS:1 n=1 Tax=Funneliformis geosporum TaxID=1117311 RepID=A0A9W4X0Q9_9GLOM|nr:7248_t:CDS:2 [Funneliformis geosporum]